MDPNNQYNQQYYPPEAGYGQTDQYGYEQQAEQNQAQNQ